MGNRLRLGYWLKIPRASTPFRFNIGPRHHIPFIKVNLETCWGLPNRIYAARPAHCSNRSAPNYKNPQSLVITLRLPLYPDQTLGERIRKWRLERGLFQVDMAKRIGVSEMIIVNWEKGKTKPIKQYFDRLEKTMPDAEL